MKIGDLVRDNHPNRTLRIKPRHGVLVAQTRIGTSSLNKSFRVLWRDGTVGDNVWDYDLRVISESR
jgi:hypothetical protein